MTDISVLILAGQREGVVDPLCQAAGVSHKAKLPLLGRPMMDYVLDALTGAKLRRPFFVSGLDVSGETGLAAAPTGIGPAGSAYAAMTSGIPFPCLITTCDHPLLSVEMLESFLTQAKASGADLCVGLAEKKIIQPAYPNVKRTYLNFADRPVSGCNMFYLANEKSLVVIEFWKQAQQHRKNPMKLAWQIGPRVLLTFLTGRLTLYGAFAYVSKKLGLNIKPVLIPIAEAAIDVDKPSDKALVEHILNERSNGT